MNDLLKFTLYLLVTIGILSLLNSYINEGNNKKIRKPDRANVLNKIKFVNRKISKSNKLVLPNTRICNPGARSHNKHIHYANGWLNNCSVSLVTTIFFKNFKCINTIIRVNPDNKDLIKKFKNNKFIKVKSGIHYLKFKDSFLSEKDKIEANFCKDYLENNEYEMVTINWIPFNELNKYRNQFKVLSISVKD